MYNAKKLSLELMDKIYPLSSPLFQVKQLDTIDLTLGLTLHNEVFIPNEQSITVYGLRQDNERPKQSTEIKVVDNTLNIKLNNSFTEIDGIVQFELEFEDQEGVLTSTTYSFLVTPRLRNEYSYESSNITQLLGANAEATKLIKDLTNAVAIAIEKNQSLDTSLVESVEVLKDLNHSIELGITTHNDLDTKYKEVLEWAEDFDYNESIPQMQEDIKLLRDKKAVIHML